MKSTRPIHSERIALRRRLEERRPEIEQAIATRVYAISDPSEVGDPEYAAGLRAALDAALDYGLLAVELGERRAPPPPPVLLTQARIAARHGVSLDTVLRRYFAGYGLLTEFIMQKTEEPNGGVGISLQALLSGQAALFDRLIAAVSEEYRREIAGQSAKSAQQRRAERIDRLLAGELIGTSELNYQMEDCHLGLVARGPDAEESIRALAASLDQRLLLAHRHRSVLWAWLGSRRGVNSADLDHLDSNPSPEPLVLAVGEPASGIEGWRLTHRQASAAFPIADDGRTVTRYADVVLLASAVQDDLLRVSLRRLYLDPLADQRDGGVVLRQTLRAYFASGRQVSSMAAALGASRQTVTKRLNLVEEKLGRPLETCAAELETALRLREIDSGGEPEAPTSAHT